MFGQISKALIRAILLERAAGSFGTQDVEGEAWCDTSERCLVKSYGH